MSKKPRRARNRTSANTSPPVAVSQEVSESPALVSAGNHAEASPHEASPNMVSRQPEFWDGVLLGLGFEPRQAREVRGASGVAHSVVSVGVDDSTKRLVIISAEADARAAAFAQTDIQTATPGYQVIAARPLIVSGSRIATALTQETGQGQVSLKTFASFAKLFDASDEEITATLAPFTSLFEAIDQWARTASSVNPVPLEHAIRQLLEQVKPIQFIETANDVAIDLNGMIDTLPTTLDSQLGICGFPLYDMSDQDLSAVCNHRDLDLVQEILRHHGIYQFFYPPPDQLLLGTVERGGMILQSEAPTVLAERLGHPPGEMELIPVDTPLPDLIDALQERKLLVSGEMAFELTPEGMTQRSIVRYSPREGIVSKIINRVSVSVDLKQILGFSVGGNSGDGKSSKQ